MINARAIQAVDSHTEGMPTRVVVAGVKPIPGATMLERKEYFEQHLDDTRLWLMREPRGHGAMSGAILQPPTRTDADWGVLFIEVSGCLPMCGHGTIGVATVLIETGMVSVTEPETVIRLDMPAGLVEARVAVSEGRATRVAIHNVPSFSVRTGATVSLPGQCTVTYDLAYGGNFFALAEATGLGLVVGPSDARPMLDLGLRLMTAVNEHDAPVHPDDSRINGCRHVVFHEPGRDGVDVRTATVIHPGWLDRSPCGTGTSALMAQRYAQGALAVGEAFVNESLLGSRFEGRIVSEREVGRLPAVVPEISGRAWITGTATYVLSPDDPFPSGFTI